MKKILDWKSREVVNIWNDVNLWSAPFGRILLENIPMQQGWTVLDIGFGTGFPLIELSQRFGNQSKIYGIDIWEEAIKLVNEKIDVLDIQNIEILEESAVQINIPEAQIDLVTSSLGINNFDEKERVYSEIHRVLKPNGKLCITTNPIGTFQELFRVFDTVCTELNLPEVAQKIQQSVNARKDKSSIVSEIEAHGFKLVQAKTDVSNIRFANADAVLNHSLIRVGFRAYWEAMVTPEMRELFFQKVLNIIAEYISNQGEFQINIPILYLEFQK